MVADGLFLCGDVDDEEVLKLHEETSLLARCKDDDWEVAGEGASSSSSNQHTDSNHNTGAGSPEEEEGGSQSFLRSHLDNQFLFRDKYGHRRGSQCSFCSWDCAREWNSKHTSVQHRHSTSQLISIAEGKFV